MFSGRRRRRRLCWFFFQLNILLREARPAEEEHAAEIAVSKMWATHEDAIINNPCEEDGGATDHEAHDGQLNPMTAHLDIGGQQ